LLKSLNFKLLSVITLAFAITAFCVLFVADIRLTQVIDKSQDAVFKEKIDTIWRTLNRSNLRLKKTGLIATYLEDFQESALETLRSAHYKVEDASIAPFIIDLKGQILMHPVHPRGMNAMDQMALSPLMLTQKQGEFEHLLSGEKNWTVFRQFREWEWVIGYTIPLSVKYADVKRFNQTLAKIMAGISFIVLVILSVIVTRFIRPIVKLTGISTQIAGGNLDQTIDLGGRDEIGTLAQSFARMRDSIKQQIMALKTEKDRADNILEGTNAGTWDWDIETGRVIVNHRWAEIIGYRDENADRITDQVWEDSIHPEDLSYVKEMVDSHFKEKTEYFEIEYRQRHESEKWVWVITRGKVVKRHPDGTPERMSGTHIDITDRKKLETRLQQAQKMESIGNLAGGIAHDFNNLLFPIIGLAELLKEDLPEGSPQHKHAKGIFRAGKRAGDLVNQILTFSRQSEDKMIPVSVQTVLREVLKLSRSTIPSNIEIHKNIQQDCGKVLANPTQIHQIAMNLITNAYHAVEEKNGTIELELKQIVLSDNDLTNTPIPSGEYVRLSVSDNGIGIPGNAIHKIFEPYFTTKKKGKGTGLGLAVVYGIIKEHSGDIKVYSEEGKGTTFIVYLPVMKDNLETAVIDKEPEMAAGKENILLVDDETPVAELEGQILSRLGYQVTVETDSLTALETFRSQPDAFDLVISDMTMPKMTGDQLAKKILAIRADIPIVICTGFSEKINENQAKDIGVKGFLMKPVPKVEMTQMLRKILD